ncbi:MAG: hypothetical protein SFV32_06310 [Opitutaceae bacterium]|nr:hypothetical protein [Opitutaceae bacterium]
MHAQRLLFAAVLVAIFAIPLRAFSLLERIEPDVLVVTDVTDAGRSLPEVSPLSPVYFKGITLGARLGTFPGDKEPDIKELTQFITRLLAKQGYRGSPGSAHPPTLFLVLQWGYMRRGADHLWFLGYNPADDIAAPKMINMLGPEIFLRNMRSRETQAILDMADEDLYGIIITAFEHESAKTDKPVILWQTRVAFPATGNYMKDALPKMATVAAAQIGRETKKPVLRDPADYRNEQSTLGELEVLDWERVPEAETK